MWFQRYDGKWEEMFIVKPSPTLMSAVPQDGGGGAGAGRQPRLLLGLFAARPYGTSSVQARVLMYYTGTVVGDMTREGRERADRVVRYSANGQYVMQVGSEFIDGRREGGAGNPAYLMNDLGYALNNVHMDGAGAVKVGQGRDRTCRIREGDELCWSYGADYWSIWPGVRTIGRVEKKRNPSGVVGAGAAQGARGAQGRGDGAGAGRTGSAGAASTSRAARCERRRQGSGDDPPPPTQPHYHY